ncbi:hypothetical protein ATE69_20360 [Sphingopyxis sp. H071]|nr:hypothetical protein ATE61_14180 [Sphingopyxis sp. H057]KTE49523.1 hypothetical protein ATE69_20360 [Sphingopyxis sp. H071]KTE52215.1 hypothetical protein ATE64_12485 [Sphingopyxis sp. H073]KTE60453.1 hypothetical protein ATE66_07660 [Sphingopyxis sp. H107]KTE63959.1 hypothetical protein ATE65_14275 [Sphingopyxis sp. H100]KTE68798.1 hypothetical protein ATE60_17875 [Sphingopyxis sp. H081]KTE80393.1 hypothetical protein ATE63_12595 [Sphingopyxis sp. H067]
MPFAFAIGAGLDIFFPAGVHVAFHVAIPIGDKLAIPLAAFAKDNVRLEGQGGDYSAKTRHLACGMIVRRFGEIGIVGQPVI